MADKLLLVSAFIVLTLPDTTLVNRLPLWLTVIIISRDIAIVTDGGDRQSRHRPPHVQALAPRQGGHGPLRGHGA